MNTPLIFINYRRDDTLATAERLFKDLKAHFGQGSVYRDERSIPPGAEWPKDLRDALDKCEVVLALIGPQWEHLRDATGQRRIDATGDWVRSELEKALEQGKRLIPIFINRHVLEVEAYPESIKAVHGRQAVSLNEDNWESGLRSIIEHLEDVYEWELRQASKRFFLREIKQGSLKHLRITDTLLADIKSENKNSDGKEWIDTSVDMSGETMPLYKAITQLWKERERHALLIGEGGMGKTVSLVRLWETLLERHDGPIPLFLSLERFNNAEEQKSFIEDTLLNDYYGHSADDILRAKIRNIWHKPGINDQPRVVLLLDGLNEISKSEKTPEVLKDQLLRLSDNFPGLQIVITSRYPSFEVDQFTNLYLSPLAVEKADEYLSTQNVTVLEDANIRSVFYNPLLLTLYAKTTNEDQNYRKSTLGFYKPKINTKGELLWNFTILNLAKQRKQWNYSDTYKDYALYLVRVFLPWLGYRMERAEIFSIDGAAKVDSGSKLNARQLFEECVAQHSLEVVTVLTNYELKKTVLKDFNVEDILFFASRHLKLLTETPNPDGEEKLENITFRFLHQEFRSFFAGVYVLNELKNFYCRCKDMKPQKRADYIPKVLRDWRWNMIISQYVGEVSGEYQNAPKVVEKRWIKPHNETEVLQTLSLLRDIFKEKQVRYSVANIISAIRSVREDFSGEDFSRLYLEGIKWQNIRLSHINGEGFFACDFSNSRLNPEAFLPVSHFAMATNNYPLSA